MYEPETNAVVCLFDPENNITEESWKVGRWKEATEMEKEKLFYEEAPEDETFMERHLIEGDKEKNLEDCLTAALPIRNSEGRIYAFAMTELPMLGIVLNAALYTFLYLVMMFLFILTNLIIHPLTAPKGYIATRVLLPFYAFMVLAVNEIFQTAYSLPLVNGKGIPVIFGKYIAAVLCALCVCIFVSRIDLDKTKDWKND